MEDARRKQQTKHAAHVRAAKIALALLAVLVAGSAAGQGGATQQTAQQGTSGGSAQAGNAGAAQPPAGTPVPQGPSYGPVLHPQTTKSEPGAQPEQTPQAQEEKARAAGATVLPRHQEVDPSARPAPQQKDPARARDAKAGRKDARKQTRRAVQGRVDPVPQVEPGPPQAPPPPPPGQPVSAMPAPAQLNGCMGGTCTDTNGTVYNTGAGNAAMSSAGRLCTRSGNTMQCF